MLAKDGLTGHSGHIKRRLSLAYALINYIWNQRVRKVCDRSALIAAQLIQGIYSGIRPDQRRSYSTQITSVIWIRS